MAEEAKTITQRIQLTVNLLLDDENPLKPTRRDESGRLGYATGVHYFFVYLTKKDN